jgi:hypothetical protein
MKYLILLFIAGCASNSEISLLKKEIELMKKDQEIQALKSKLGSDTNSSLKKSRPNPIQEPKNTIVALPQPSKESKNKQSSFTSIDLGSHHGVKYTFLYSETKLLVKAESQKKMVKDIKVILEDQNDIVASISLTPLNDTIFGGHPKSDPSKSKRIFFNINDGDMIFNLKINMESK